jgi:hypothetical protein
MMECWNTGIMGSGMMQCWINGPATGGSDDKIKMANILLKNQYSIVPPFHYSILEQIRKFQKISIFSVGCRKFEMYYLKKIRR